MPLEILKLVIAMILMMVAMRFAFAEIDGRNAIKRSNLAYFLHFEDKFKYKSVMSSMVVMVMCFLIFSDIDITTSEGLFVFILFFVIGMLSDVISSFAYHCYGKYRFKDKISEVNKFIATLKLKLSEPVQEDDAYVYGQDYQFVDVLSDYIEPKDHFVCLSTDGGELVESMEEYPQVSFLIDRKGEEAKLRLEDKPVRLTTLTQDNRYPFKDERMDVVVCYNENFNPDEGKRILKDGGTLLINQLGSDNLLELYAFLGPRLFTTKWDLATLKKGLRNNGYSILSGHEERAEIRFRTLAAFHHYVKDMAFMKLDDVKYYINQFFLIDQTIEKNGFFAMQTHRFYVAARKDNVDN